MMAVWVAQAMWWDGCAGYVVVFGTFYNGSWSNQAGVVRPN